MRITPNIMESVIAEVVGSDALPIVKILTKSESVSELDIAKKLKKDIKDTRNTLYRLFNHNLVYFERGKDKLKGLYIYYWSFNKKRIKQLVYEMDMKKLTTIKVRYDREKSNQFFICMNKCVRLEFDQAITYKFKCPECGCLMNIDDNHKIIEQLHKKMDSLEKKLKVKI